MKLELFGFQREDVDRFKAEGHKAGLFAYDMALGKTLTATTLTVELGTRVNLIVAPQVTFDGWEKAVQTQTEGKEKLQWMKKNSKAGQQAIIDYYDGKPGWYFITWQLMRGGVLFETKADMVIGDEIHEIQNKNKSAQNILLSKIESEYRIGLSGTASGNKLSGIYGVISWLWPKRYTSYWKWLKHHFLLAGHGYALTPVRERIPGSVTADLPFYVRRLKDDHYDDMVPKPKELKVIEVELSPKQREIYNNMEESSGTWLGDSEEDGFLFSSHSIVKAQRLREIALGTPTMEMAEDGRYMPVFSPDAKSSKMDKVEEIIKAHPGEPFVIYTHSKKFISTVIARLEKIGVSAKPFTGDLNYKQKRKMIDTLGDDYQVMVATQASVGTGTDGLQHKASKLIWLSRDIQVKTNTQARDRLYRPGQKDRIEQWEIVAIGTNDVDTNANIDYAEETVGNMLDANRIRK